MTIEQDGKCAGCRFWSGDMWARRNVGGSPEFGCRRHAPTASQLVTTNRYEVGGAQFPPMPSDGWCGDYEAAPRVGCQAWWKVCFEPECIARGGCPPLESTAVLPEGD